MIQTSSSIFAKKATFTTSPVRRDARLKLEYWVYTELVPAFGCTGVNEPGFHVIVDFTAMQVYLVAPTVSETDVMWKGATANTSELLQQYDADYIISEDDLEPTLRQLAPSIIHVLDTTDTTALPADYLTLLKRDELRPALTRARLTKFPWEITALRCAGNATSHCHTALMARFPSLFNQKKITEGRVAALFTGLAAACHGLDRQAYVPIVASGTRAATLHNTRRSGRIEPGALVLIDAGVEAGCYSSDVTRTFPASGTFSPEARTIYDIVLKMQKVCSVTCIFRLCTDATFAHKILLLLHAGSVGEAKSGDLVARHGTSCDASPLRRARCTGNSAWVD